MNWPGLELSVLQAYRQAHRLNTPSSFSSSYNQRILCRQGIGWASPTMALHKDRRRVSKESLALAVRKDFKDAMVHESEAITCFLYSAQNQSNLSSMPLSPFSLISLQPKISACALLRHDPNKKMARWEGWSLGFPFDSPAPFCAFL